MFEHYIGVDWHQALFQACAVTVTGDRAWEGRFPRTDAGMAAWAARCSQRSALAVDASTPTWHFADAMCRCVGDLRIVGAVKTKLKAGYAAKTDRLSPRISTMRICHEITKTRKRPTNFVISCFRGKSKW